MKLKKFIASLLFIMLIVGIVGFAAWGTAGFKDKQFGRVNKAIEKIKKKEPNKKNEINIAPEVLLKGKELTKNIDEVMSKEYKQVMFRGATAEGTGKKVELHVKAEPINAQAEITARLLFKGTKTTKNSKGEEIDKYLAVRTIKNKGYGIFEIEKKLTFEEEAVLELKAGEQTYEITIGCLADEFVLTWDFVKAGRFNVNADVNKSLFEFNLEKALNAIGKSIGTQKDKFKAVISYDSEITFNYSRSQYDSLQNYLKKMGNKKIDEIFKFEQFVGKVGSEAITLSGHEKVMSELFRNKYNALFRGKVIGRINEAYCNGNMLKEMWKIFNGNDVTSDEYKKLVRDYYNNNGNLDSANKFGFRLGRIKLKLENRELVIKRADTGIAFPEIGFDLVGVDNPVTKITGIDKIDV